jgi:ABC-2 type transport system permease protein
VSSVTMAFLRRDALIFASYRTSVLSFVFGGAVLLGVVYFLGHAVEADSEHLERYGGDYVAFLLVGFAFADLFGRGLCSLPASLRDQQQSGTLEPLLVAPVGLRELVIGSSVFHFTQSLVRAGSILAFGAIFLGLWHNANLLSVAIVLLPATVAMFALGLFFAAFVVLIKQADPVISSYNLGATVLGGVLFPVQALPAWIAIFAWLFPLSHALSGLRLALNGEPPSGVLGPAIALTIIAVLLLPTSVFAFRYSIKRAKKEGTLVQY